MSFQTIFFGLFLLIPSSSFAETTKGNLACEGTYRFVDNFVFFQDLLDRTTKTKAQPNVYQAMRTSIETFCENSRDTFKSDVEMNSELRKHCWDACEDKATESALENCATACTLAEKQVGAKLIGFNQADKPAVDCFKKIGRVEHILGASNPSVQSEKLFKELQQVLQPQTKREHSGSSAGAVGYPAR